MSKAMPIDRRWLELQGAYFQKTAKRGWYYKGDFIGYNALEAGEKLEKLIG